MAAVGDAMARCEALGAKRGVVLRFSAAVIHDDAAIDSLRERSLAFLLPAAACDVYGS